MDLSLLPHLSDDALRTEAKKRGVAVEGLERDALITAIRAAEAVAVTTPPPAPDEVGPTWPPKADPLRATERPPRGSAIGTARALFGRVVSMAKSALDRRDEAPEAASAPEAPSEPIATRTMAELLVKQGHLERARAVLVQLGRERGEDAATRAMLASVEAELTDRMLEKVAARRPRNAAFVEIVRAEPGRGVVWHLDDAALARGSALLGDEGALTLRVVEIVAHPDHAVESRRVDHGPIERDGSCRLDVAPNARVVVSVGLAEGDRFVSMLHASG